MGAKRLSVLALLSVILFLFFTPPLRGDALPKSASDLHWVRYTDSAEGAFSIEVPVGWQVQGGMYRFGYFDVRWMMDVRALNGKVIIRIDDPNVPPYVLPGPHSGPAGQAAIKPQQYQMIVDNYRDGQDYAEKYAKQRFAGVCKTWVPTKSAWRPTIPGAWRTDGASRVTEGTAAYDCSTSDGPRTINVYARSTLYPSSGLWQVDPIISVIESPENSALAAFMVQHMIDSWQINPEWENYQKQMTQKGLDQIRAGFQQFLQQMQVYHQQREAAMNQQVARFESQQHAQAQQASNWGETLTGLTTLHDPTTGTTFQVFSGPKSNYYTNGMGVTINSSLPPGGNFHAVDVVNNH